MNKKELALVIQVALLGSITFSTQFLSAQEKEVTPTETTEIQADGSRINPAEVADEAEENQLIITG